MSAKLEGSVPGMDILEGTRATLQRWHLEVAPLREIAAREEWEACPERYNAAEGQRCWWIMEVIFSSVGRGEDMGRECYLKVHEVA
jgi:hypothetical protein